MTKVKLLIICLVLISFSCIKKKDELMCGDFVELEKLDRGKMFFFSSSRQHTRCGRDWSSDVCSSDLNDGHDLRLARTDGTTAGTQIIPEINSGGANVTDVKSQMAVLNGEIYMSLAHEFDGYELWKKIGRASCREKDNEGVDATELINN